MGRGAVAVVLLLAVANPTNAAAQLIEAPSRRDARGPAELAAYDKAMCVYRGMTEATKVFTLSPAARVKPDMLPRVNAELEQFAVKSKGVARNCLSEQEVYDLGRYSYLEDMAFAEGTPCRLAKTPAARFGRTPNNSDGDIVNGAVRWNAISTQESLGVHPFFQGQNEAREQFRGVRSEVLCRVILDEFGPSGLRFPGMVRRK